MPRDPGRMRGIGEQTIARTNEELADSELKLLQNTNVDWNALRPKIHDKAAYDALITVIQESTQNNDNLAEFKNRMVALGKEGWNVAKKVIELAT